jgi:hypothetical protein
MENKGQEVEEEREKNKSSAGSRLGESLLERKKRHERERDG